MTYHIKFDIDFKRNTYPGAFIAIEGIDGSGKTTQVQRVAERLGASKVVFVTKNPTDGPVGQFIRKVLKKEIVLPSVSFQYLFSADRQVQQVEVIEHLKQGEVVITDRYFWSALAYGIVDRGATDFNKNGSQLLITQSMLSMYHQFIVPNNTFYLAISVEEAKRRLSQMDKTKELYEEEEKLKKIDAAYHWIIEQFPKEITVINGEQPVDAVTEGIIGKLPKSLK